MRLVIDMQGAQTASRFRGIGRYSVSLIKAMLRAAASKHEVLLVVNAQMPEGVLAVRRSFENLLPPGSIRVFDAPSEIGLGSWDNSVSQILREAFLVSLDPDVVVVTSVVEGMNSKAVTSIGRSFKLKTAAIFYDLIPALRPDDYFLSEEIRQFYLQKIGFLKRADLLLAISESSRYEAIAHLGHSDRSVVNISAAIDEIFQVTEVDESARTAALGRMGIFKNFILYVPGGFDARKNFARLLEAYSRLPSHIRAIHQLVIVGKIDSDNYRKILGWRDQFELAEDELLLLGYVSDADLAILYAQAMVFVFPSLHEGFGLPVLEAMACGCVVLGSNATSIPEVIGNEDALFDPLSVKSIRDKLVCALINPEFRDRLRSSNQRQMLSFSWDRSAERAWRAIEALHETAGSAQVYRNISGGHSNELFTFLKQDIAQYGVSAANIMRIARCAVFNRGIESRQLLLDVSELARGDAKSGIQRVVRSILRECLLQCPEGFVVRPIRFDGVRYWYANELLSRLQETSNSEEDTVADFFQGDIYVCLDLLMHLGPTLHSVHKDFVVRGISLNYLIYDLLPLQHPEWWPSEIGTMFKDWIVALSHDADRMICISDAVAKELENWLGIHPPSRMLYGPEIKSFHLGADIENSLPSLGLPDNASDLLDRMAHSVSFLLVSTLEPRKGHAQVLDAFELLWAQGHDLTIVMVGKLGWKVDALVQRIEKHPENGRRLLWLRNVSDEFLDEIYKVCDCLLMASFGEGFGLPLIEAAQHGIPIISRNLPVFREVAGNHALYFDGSHAEDLSRALVEWLNLKLSDRHPKSNLLSSLTWEQSTDQLLAVLGISSRS